MDEAGQVHRQGQMRLATAKDEIGATLVHPVQANEAYLSFYLISQVVTQLGTLEEVSPTVIGGLFASDLLFLEDFYQRINSPEPMLVSTTCPRCQAAFHVQVTPFGQNGE